MIECNISERLVVGITFKVPEMPEDLKICCWTLKIAEKIVYLCSPIIW